MEIGIALVIVFGRADGSGWQGVTEWRKAGNERTEESRTWRRKFML
jgi:hypothetical protein